MLDRDALYSLEEYEKLRPKLRDKVMAYKRKTTIDLGAHLRLYFEDKLTIQYQIQEMLRAEKIFTAAGIQEELDTYNPLISHGNHIMATMMVVYPNVAEREVALAQLVGIENSVWLQVVGHNKVTAIADEDLERADEHKTSAVHFLRFTLDAPMLETLSTGGAVQLGVHHAKYHAETAVGGDIIFALLGENSLTLE